MTRCRYLNTYTYMLPPVLNAPASTRTFAEICSVHVCSFCAGKGEYKTSEDGKRKVRK